MNFKVKIDRIIILLIDSLLFVLRYLFLPAEWVFSKFRPRSILLCSYQLEVSGASIVVDVNRKHRIHPSKFRRNIYSFTANIPNGAAIPEFFVDGHKGEGKTLYATEYAHIHHSQKLGLEGDFDKYFQVYAPIDYEVEVLEFLSPDVMDLLKENLRSYDMKVKYGIFELNTIIYELDSTEKIVNQVISKFVRKVSGSTVDEKMRMSSARIDSDTEFEAMKIGKRLVSTSTFVTILLVALPMTMFVGNELLTQASGDTLSYNPFIRYTAYIFV
jgi:hypothetical protein